MLRAIRASVLVPLLGLALAGCGGAPLPPAGASGAGQSAPAVTPLPAGTYASLSFQPPVTFTVPDGWVITADGAAYFAVQPAGNDAIGMHLFSGPRAALQDAACTKGPEPGVGATSADLVAWITTRPGFAVGSPLLASVGGLHGVSIDVALRDTWTQSCPFASGLPAVPLFDSPGIDRWVVAGSERLRLIILDTPSGGTVVVDLDAFDGGQFEDLLGRASGIVRSLKFDTGAPSSAAPASAGASAVPGSSAAPPSAAPSQ